MDSFDEDNLGWYSNEIHGSWIAGVSDGGFSDIKKNPQYLVRLEDTDLDSDDTCTCLISLLQVDGRRKRAKGISFEEAFAPIGFILLPAMDGEAIFNENVLRTALEEYQRYAEPYRANTRRIETPPGEYLIIPIVDDLDDNEELHFLLRIFSEMPISMLSDQESDNGSDHIVTDAILGAAIEDMHGGHGGSHGSSGSSSDEDQNEAEEQNEEGEDGSSNQSGVVVPVMDIVSDPVDSSSEDEDQNEESEGDEDNENEDSSVSGSSVSASASVSDDYDVMDDILDF